MDTGSIIENGSRNLQGGDNRGNLPNVVNGIADNGQKGKFPFSQGMMGVLRTDTNAGGKG